MHLQRFWLPLLDPRRKAGRAVVPRSFPAHVEFRASCLPAWWWSTTTRLGGTYPNPDIDQYWPPVHDLRDVPASASVAAGIGLGCLPTLRSQARADLASQPTPRNGAPSASVDRAVLGIEVSGLLNPPCIGGMGGP